MLPKNSHTNMPSVSRKQQQAMCMAYAARKKEIPVSDLKGAALEIYNSEMTDDQIKDFTVVKEMRSLSNYLIESLQQVYHYTNYGNLFNILKENQFVLSENDDYGDSKYKYYMSTTRQRNALTGYPTGMINPKISRIILDYDLLRSKYKIGPVDWGKSKKFAIKTNYPGDIEYFDKWFDSIRLQTNVEMEERVYSNKEVIPHFVAYIKQIDVMSGWLTKHELDELKEVCSNIGLNLNIYNTEKDFNLAR